MSHQGGDARSKGDIRRGGLVLGGESSREILVYALSYCCEN